MTETPHKLSVQPDLNENQPQNPRLTATLLKITGDFLNQVKLNTRHVALLAAILGGMLFLPNGLSTTINPETVQVGCSDSIELRPGKTGKSSDLVQTRRKVTPTGCGIRNVRIYDPSDGDLFIEVKQVPGVDGQLVPNFDDRNLLIQPDGIQSFRICEYSANTIGSCSAPIRPGQEIFLNGLVVEPAVPYAIRTIEVSGSDN